MIDRRHVLSWNDFCRCVRTACSFVHVLSLIATTWFFSLSNVRSLCVCNLCVCEPSAAKIIQLRCIMRRSKQHVTHTQNTLTRTSVIRRNGSLHCMAALRMRDPLRGDPYSAHDLNRHPAFLI